jgi:uncharacterized protein (TIRG00374 family)
LLRFASNNKIHWFFLCFLLLCITVLFVKGEGKWQFLQLVDWRYLFYALLINSVCVFMDFYNWRFYLQNSSSKQLDKLLSGRQLVQLNRKNIIFPYLSGFSVDFLPAKLGTFSRAFFLHINTTFPVAKGVAVQASALTIDLIAALIIAFVFTIVNLSQYLSFLYFLSLSLLILFIVYLLYQYLITNGKAHYYLKKWLSQSMLKYSDKVILELKHLLVLKNIHHPLLIKCISWPLLGVSFYTLILGFGYSTDIQLVILAITISAIGGSASMLPGGIGTTDLSLYGFCLIMDIPADTAIIIVFSYRIISFWYLLILGNLCTQYLFTGKETKKLIADF